MRVQQIEIQLGSKKPTNLDHCQSKQYHNSETTLTISVYSANRIHKCIENEASAC